jgi:hypothetical protein
MIHGGCRAVVQLASTISSTAITAAIIKASSSHFIS